MTDTLPEIRVPCAFQRKECFQSFDQKKHLGEEVKDRLGEEAILLLWEKIKEASRKATEEHDTGSPMLNECQHCRFEVFELIKEQDKHS